MNIAQSELLYNSFPQRGSEQVCVISSDAKTTNPDLFHTLRVLMVNQVKCSTHEFQKQKMRFRGNSLMRMLTRGYTAFLSLITHIQDMIFLVSPL